MLEAIADTHTVIWYIFADSRLSSTARMTIEEAALRGNQIGISAITLAEIVYLSEKNRISADTLPRLLDAFDQENSLLIEILINRTLIDTMQRVSRIEIPELPDRIIAATSLHFGLPVISRDRKIQASGIESIW